MLAVDVVEPDSIRDRDARRAGYPSTAELVADLRGDSTLPLYRIEFRAVHEPDPRDVVAADARLTAADVAEIDRRPAWRWAIGCRRGAGPTCAKAMPDNRNYGNQGQNSGATPAMNVPGCRL